MVEKGRGEDACWLWIGATDLSGYGKLKRHGVMLSAHRVAWEIANERRVPEGMHVRHSCHQPLCCRPDHLSAGSRVDNMRDMVAAGRQARGEGHGMSVLNDDIVRQIRRMGERGLAVREIAKAVGRNAGTVSEVLRGRTWRHVI
jgi:hypothetical protein